MVPSYRAQVAITSDFFDCPKTTNVGSSLEQVNLILSSAKEPRRIHYAVLAFTGMRLGELQHLRRVDVDLAENWLHIVSRPGASLEIPIDVDYTRPLGGCEQDEWEQEYLANVQSQQFVGAMSLLSEPVFGSPEGRPSVPPSLSYWS